MLFRSLPVETAFFAVSPDNRDLGPQKAQHEVLGRAEALRTSMSLEHSRKTQSVSEGAERAREPIKKIALSQECGDFFCVYQKNVVSLQRKMKTRTL